MESQSVYPFNDALLAHFGLGWTVGASSMGQMPPAWASDPWITDRHGDGRVILENAFPVEPWAFKDPRLCVLLPFWRAVAEERAGALLVVRHPMEIALSLHRRNGLPLTEGLAMWEYHLGQAMENLNGMAVLATRYEDAVADPAGWCEATASWLQRLGLIAATRNGRPVASEWIDSALRHQDSDRESTDLMSAAQHSLYDALLESCGLHEAWSAKPPLGG